MYALTDELKVQMARRLRSAADAAGISLPPGLAHELVRDVVMPTLQEFITRAIDENRSKK